MEGTCNWVLSQSWFQDWSSYSFLESSPKLLWINGPAGFGKTVLSTKIVDHLSSDLEETVAYFFFSNDLEREDPFVAVRNWISQMMSLPAAFTIAREIWGIQVRPMASRDDLMAILGQIVIDVPKLTFVVDGLDECTWLREHQKPGIDDSIPNFLEALRDAFRDTATRFMIVSRNEPEIRDWLHSYAHCCSVIEHNITPEDVQTDVSSYSQKIVHEELKKSTEAAKISLGQKLALRCNGQFLWVTLQQESLRRNSWRSEKEIEQTINSTPREIENLYLQSWIKIQDLPGRDRDRALSLLRWTAFSLRPLTVNEITEALLISQIRDEVHLDEAPEKIDEHYIESGILNYSGSLLEVRSHSSGSDPGTRTVHLAHFSIKQFLIHRISGRERSLQLDGDSGGFTERAENTSLAIMCLRYVNGLATVRSSHGKDVTPLGCLFNYCAGSWQQHAHLGEPRNDDIIRLTNMLFDISEPGWEIWKEWLDQSHPETRERPSNMKDSPGTPIYYAALLGLNDTVHFLISSCRNHVDEKDALGNTALIVACEKGHISTVKALLAEGADIGATNNDGCSPLNIASCRGHVQIVRFLLQQGADLRARDIHGWDSILRASQSGHIAVVRILLDNGADINVTSGGRWTPIHTASEHGHLEVVRFLLQRGADTAIGNVYGSVTLTTASRYGHLGVVKALLDSGCDINIRSDQGTPVFAASENGHVEIVKLLLQRAADLNIRDKHGWDPILKASQSGHLEIVKILLDAGANINSTSGGRWTPVHAAAIEGHAEVVRALLGQGANARIGNVYGSIPITTASRAGHVEVVRLLLESRVNVNSRDANGWTALTAASLQGHFEIVQLLLEKGADLTVTLDSGSTALNEACIRGNFGLVGLLLKYGADQTISNDDGWTPIHTASEHGHLEIVKLLYQNGADVKATNIHGSTPLNEATRKGHLEVVGFLLENGSDVNFANNLRETPVNTASKCGYLDVVKALCKYGADIHTPASNGASPIWAAAEAGHLKIVQFLFDHGTGCCQTI